MPTGDTDLRKTEAPAVDSATVMLVRDGRDGVEVFMLQRHGKADFGGAWVFPGGVAAVADGETDLEAFCAGLDDASASAQLGLREGVFVSGSPASARPSRRAAICSPATRKAVTSIPAPPGGRRTSPATGWNSMPGA